MATEGFEPVVNWEQSAPCLKSSTVIFFKVAKLQWYLKIVLLKTVQIREERMPAKRQFQGCLHLKGGRRRKIRNQIEESWSRPVGPYNFSVNGHKKIVQTLWATWSLLWLLSSVTVARKQPQSKPWLPSVHMCSNKTLIYETRWGPIWSRGHSLPIPDPGEH